MMNSLSPATCIHSRLWLVALPGLLLASALSSAAATADAPKKAKTEKAPPPPAVWTKGVSFELWSGGPMPKKAEIPRVAGVALHDIIIEGYTWSKGPALARHRGAWFLMLGLNTGSEQTDTEEAWSFRSATGRDWGRLEETVAATGERRFRLTKSDLTVIDAPPGERAASHGVFKEYEGVLWAFTPSFYGRGRPGGRIHTRAFRYDDAGARWSERGTVVEGEFWPLQEPFRLENGQWLMAGLSMVARTPPAVALCRDSRFMQWEVVRVPVPAGITVWGEPTVIGRGANLLMISRSASKPNEVPPIAGYPHPLAWVSESRDFGRTWSELQPSNMPMADSKPYAGTLSTGQNYLICTTAADAGSGRGPLTIAVSRPGSRQFSKVYSIREWGAYPYAVEHDGQLWVSYYTPRRTKEASVGVAIIPIASFRGE